MIRIESRTEFMIDRSATRLEDVINLVKTGPWRFVQLRGEPLDQQSINHGDVDLLGTTDSVFRLLSAAFDWVQSGRGHILIRARNRNKITLSFVSLDGNNRITFDLWMAVWQLNGGKTALKYDDCAHLAVSQSTSIRRLPVSIEACIYLHHLNVKKNKLKTDHTRLRLNRYHTACLHGGETVVAEIIDEVLRRRQVDVGCLDTLNDHLSNAGVPLATMQRGGMIKKITYELAAAWLDGPRPARYIAIAGGDGSGKSTLSRTLRESDSGVNDLVVGKRLYRNSILYKILVIFGRPFLGRDKNQFDDWIAPFVYIRASWSLRIKTWLRRPGLELIDRSLVDFLVIDRKTDNPRFHRCAWMSSVMGVRIPVVHLVVPPKILQMRKQELTEAGQQKYDRLMFEHFTRRSPTTYAVFFNGTDLHPATGALSKVLRLIAKVSHV